MLACAAGIGLVLVVLDAAVSTLLLPRGRLSWLTRAVLAALRWLFEVLARRGDTYERRDRVMALYAPLALMALLLTWLVATLVAFAAIFWAIEQRGIGAAFEESGSSLLTLGFTKPVHPVAIGVAFAEAGVGLILVALLIAYLPTIYATFSKREVMVTQYAVRASTPPTGWDLLSRAQQAGYLAEIDGYFTAWETWFVELQETHTSLGIVAFLRSPDGARSWITTAGAVLDGAALRMSVVDLPFSAAGGLCIRSGHLALGAIADVYHLPHRRDVRPDDPISIERREFDEVVAELRRVGVPLVADLDGAWRDFAGWRVNYDAVLLQLAALFVAPYAPWSSDRSPPLAVDAERGAPGERRTRGARRRRARGAR